MYIAGTNALPRPQLPQFKQQYQARNSTDALERFTASLPGNQDSGARLRELFAGGGDDLEWISRAFNRRLEFEVDHQLHEVIVKVVDAETDRVIKVLPPEELRRLQRKITETIGFLVDRRV
jgi:flagellar protein FlaG